MIHPTALVDPNADLADNVQVGPYAIVEGRCTIGAGTVIDAHCIVRERCVIGENCKIGPAAYIGMVPQHLEFKGGETWAVIGSGTIIREGASVHRATKPGIENATRLGRNCFMMGDSHIGHDCQVGESVTIAHGARLGGHCDISDRAFIGGGSGIHQFCRIGRVAIVAANELVTHDIPPFAAVRYGGLKAYNLVGCRRLAMSMRSIRSVRKAFRCLHEHRTTPAAVAAIESLQNDSEEIGEILRFIASSRRGIQPSVHFLTRTRPEADCKDFR